MKRLSVKLLHSSAVLDSKSEIMSSRFPPVFLSTAKTAVAVSRAAKKGEVRKIGPRLYTSQLSGDAIEVIRANRWQVVALYAPGGVVGYRTAIEGKPTADGTVFLSGPTLRRIDLPGLRVRVVPGPDALEGDREFIGGLHLASRARALLESLRPSRARATEARGLSRDTVERILDRELDLGNEATLNALRDQASSLASRLGAEREFEVLDGIIGALLGSRNIPVTAAGALGRLAEPPYDAKRLTLFEELHTALVATPVPTRADPAAAGSAFRHLAFLDAYFSNYIEGTEFELDEARALVFEGRVLPDRPADSHDVLGTFALVGNRDFLGVGISDLPDGAAFIARLKQAHAEIMRGRPEHGPGRFKETVNRAGNSVFVHPDAVTGTLLHGFTIARSLERPFARAAALMFVISEVHPFADGNGRVARVLMNAELFAARQCRILIPTVFRDDYLTALRTMTRQGHADPLVQALELAQRVTAAIDYADLDQAIAALANVNAFEEPSTGIRLRAPNPR